MTVRRHRACGAHVRPQSQDHCPAGVFDVVHAPSIVAVTATVLTSAPRRTARPGNRDIRDFQSVADARDEPV